MLAHLAPAVFLSGFAALAYQLLWMRELALVMGTAHTAVAACLAVYMAGLAAGAAVSGRMAEGIRRPLIAFVWIELAVAAGALLMPLLLATAGPLLPRVLVVPDGVPADAGGGQWLFYSLVAIVAMGLPAMAIGATLPMLARVLLALPGSELRSLTVLYSINTAGAAMGAAAAGFLLIPRLGLSMTTLLAAGLNVLAALIAWTVARGVGASPPAGEPERRRRPAWFWVSIAGLVAVASFALEVFWARLFSHLLGGSTQGFALMLAATLAGLAIGAILVRAVAPMPERATRWLVMALAAAGLATVAGYLLISLQSRETLLSLPVLLWAVLVILPGAVALGATFPLLIGVARGGLGTLPRSTGFVSAASTAGAIVGSLGAGWFLLPLFGFEHGIAVICGALGVTALCVAWRSRLGRPAIVAAALAILGAIALAVTMPRPTALLASSVVDRADPGSELYFGVGRAATVQAQARPHGILLRSDGLPEALIARRGAPPSIDDQQWLGAIGAMAVPSASSMLVVGLGGGVALEALPQSLRRIDVVEIEPRVVEANRLLAAARRTDPLADGRVRIVLNDARNALLRTQTRYDVIVSQPSHPWTATSSTLYSREFIALAKRRLTDDGVLVQWMNAAFVDERLFRALLATLRAEFRYVRAYEPVPLAFVLLAADTPPRPERWFNSPFADAESQRRLRFAGLGGPQDLDWSLVLDERGVDAVAAGVEPLTDDRNPLTVESRPGGGMDERRVAALIGEHDSLRGLEPAAAAYVVQRVSQTRVGRLERAPALQRRAAGEVADFQQVAREISAVADGSASMAAAAAAARLPASAAAVVAGWREGRRGRTRAIEALDPSLAAAQPTDPWYATAARLRAEWRLEAAAALSPEDPRRPQLLRETLELVEEALASAVTTDLLFLRARVGGALGLREYLVESAAAFAHELNRRLADPSTRDVAVSSVQQQRLAVLRQVLGDPQSGRDADVAAELAAVAGVLRGG